METVHKRGSMDSNRIFRTAASLRGRSETPRSAQDLCHLDEDRWKAMAPFRIGNLGNAPKAVRVCPSMPPLPRFSFTFSQAISRFFRFPPHGGHPARRSTASSGSRSVVAVSSFRFRARLDVSILGAPHLSARGTLTLQNNALLSTHCRGRDDHC
jgi:hypothetical protein